LLKDNQSKKRLLSVRSEGTIKMASITKSSLKALIIDDHLIMRKYLENLLTLQGFTKIDHAASVDEAQDKIINGNYNVIFIDWHMPGQSGYYLMQHCRGEREFDDTAFVMVTSEQEDRLIREAMKAGATAYVVKPPTEVSISAAVEKVIDWIEKRASLKRESK